MTEKIRLKLISKSTECSERLFPSPDDPDDEFNVSDVKEYPSEESSVIEMTSEGVLKAEGNRVIISYDESELTGMQGSRTEVAFDLTCPELITMMRTGSVTTALVFEKGKRHICTYRTEYMPFEICVNTKDVKNELLSCGVIEMDYIIEIRGAQAERTYFRIEISHDFDRP